MSVAFEYSEWRPGGQFIGAGDGVTLRGRLVGGELSLQDRLILPGEDGRSTSGEVLRFAESFDDWLALPFYETLTPSTCEVEFCIELVGRFDSIQCPGTATLGSGNEQSG